MVELSDQEFVDNLRAAVERYLAGVDRWEAAYQKYYRMPGWTERISADLEAEQREYETQRRALEEMLPRARRLCLKHQLRDPFAGLLRISLGRHAPQHRVESAIGRNERNTATDCLVRLSEACRVWEPDIRGSEAQADSEPEPGKQSLLKRLINYFY
jgi:hypothetical protein